MKFESPKDKNQRSNVSVKELLFFSVLIILILFISYFFFLSNSDEKLNEMEKINLCSDLTGEEAEKCIIDFVDSNECVNDECFYSKAMTYNNEELCYNLSETNMKIVCTSNIKRSQILEKSVVEDDIEVCLKFDDENSENYCRDNFYIAKRYNFNDLSYCKNIIDEVMREDCEK